MAAELKKNSENFQKAELTFNTHTDTPPIKLHEQLAEVLFI